MRLLHAVLLLSSVSASSQSTSRKLFESIANYAPQTLVTSQNAIDLDQKTIMDTLVPDRDDGFGPALAVYEVGAHSEPVARLSLVPELSGSRLEVGSIVEGFNVAGTDEVIGTLLETYNPGAAIIEVAYNIDSSQGNYVKCQVGGNPFPVTEGCFKPNDRVLIGGDRRLDYSYDLSTQNVNLKSIKMFSFQARKKLYECNDPGDKCPYEDYDLYRTYYNSFTYADDWVIAAAGGTSTNFAHGNADFSKMTQEGRFEAFKRGTVYLHFFMEVIGNMEKAIDQCNILDDSKKDLWDRAVAYYTGSLEGSNGFGEGVLLYSWADKMCLLFNTCGVDSDESSGLSYVNHKVIGHFTDGKTSLNNNECNLVREKRNRIVEMMLVSLVQVVLYEAHARSVGRDDGPRSLAASATAAAAILPYIDRCEPEDAELLYDQIRVDASSTDFAVVKSILERSYECLGIQCAEVGGVYDHNSRSYFSDAEPCGSSGSGKVKKQNKSGGGGKAGLAIGLAVGGVVLLIMVVMLSSCCGEKAAPTGLSPTDEEAVVT